MLVSAAVSGDITVLLNDADHSFTDLARYRAGLGLYGLDPGGTGTVSSLQQPVAMVVGDFVQGGGDDVAVLLQGSHQIVVLQNNGRGGLANPSGNRVTAVLPFSNAPAALVVGDFNGDGQPDLALLQRDLGQVWIFQGKPDGTFQRVFTIGAGAAPTGLNTMRDPETGQIDLLVGNAFGDILTLRGHGDGTFVLPPPVPGNQVPLDVQSLNGNGPPDILVADQKTNQITVEAPTANGAGFAPIQTLAIEPEGRLAPGAVQLAKLEGSGGLFDAVVVASGANSILVYHASADGNGNPIFGAPSVYAVGDDPVAVTIQDINGDHVPDMIVANQGSNDISILFGKIVNGVWQGTPGPRLQSGGNGPLATALRDVNGDNIPDLVVTNSNSVSVLPGRGQGYFDDRPASITSFDTGPVVQSLVDASGLEFLVRADGGISTFDGTALTDVFDSVNDKVSLIGDSDGELVAAFADGNLGILKADTPGQLQLTDVDSTSLINVSALEAPGARHKRPRRVFDPCGE